MKREGFILAECSLKTDIPKKNAVNSFHSSDAGSRRDSNSAMSHPDFEIGEQLTL